MTALTKKTPTLAIHSDTDALINDDGWWNGCKFSQAGKPAGLFITCVRAPLSSRVG